jgi:DNA-binding transcriptional ArsR family regulator
MVDQADLTAVFHSLSDPTRRDILRRVEKRELSVSEIALAYSHTMSLAAVSKHLRVLEDARLITKRRVGKQQLVALSPPALAGASRYFERYRKDWEERLDSLGNYLQDANKRK